MCQRLACQALAPELPGRGGHRRTRGSRELGEPEARGAGAQLLGAPPLSSRTRRPLGAASPAASGLLAPGAPGEGPKDCGLPGLAAWPPPHSLLSSPAASPLPSCRGALGPPRRPTLTPSLRRGSSQEPVGGLLEDRGGFPHVLEGRQVVPALRAQLLLIEPPQRFLLFLLLRVRGLSAPTPP